MQTLENARQQLCEERSRSQIRVETARRSHFGDRVSERFRSSRQVKPTGPHDVGGGAAQNGAGAASTMGEDTRTFAVKIQFGFSKAHYVSISPQEDHDRSVGEVGEV
jgi:hypothetical protein